MSIATITEITATSPNSFEDAIASGIKRATQTLRNVKSAWVKDQEVTVTDNEPSAYKVTLKITFVMED